MSMVTTLPAWPQHTFRAMGSQIKFWLEAEEAAASEAFEQAQALFARNEQALSRFRPDSELSQLNARSGQWVAVSELFWDVLTQALALVEATSGMFDPTLLNALEAAGYTHTFEALKTAAPGDTPPTSMPESGSGNTIEVDTTQQAVWLPPGVRLDFGGIAKGYTAQQAADYLSQWGPCLVDAGGDVTAGRTPTGWPGWPVALTTPWVSENIEQANLFIVWLKEATLATSGIDYRRWLQNGQPAHHLIDPRTGRPASTDTLTTTVWATEAATADAWATATLVLGVAEGSYILNDREIAAAFVGMEGQLSLTLPMYQFISNQAVI